MERVDYKSCLAPQSHQEPICRHHYYLLSGNGRTLSALFLVKRAGRWPTCPVAQIQISHQWLYQTLSSPQSAGCYNCSIAQHKRQCFPSSNQQMRKKKIIGINLQPSQAHDGSPKNHGRWRICHQGSLRNTGEMHQVWHIIAWCPATISILERVNALVVPTGTAGIWGLCSIPAPLVWTRDQWRCWWAPRVEVIELNL